MNKKEMQKAIKELIKSIETNGGKMFHSKDKTNCLECQFESGEHSQSCSKYKEQKWEIPQQGWEKEIYMMCPSAEVAADFVRVIRQLLLKIRQDLLKEIDILIVQEIIIAQKEGQTTSRLTSLAMKIREEKL